MKAEYVGSSVAPVVFVREDSQKFVYVAEQEVGNDWEDK